jgi:glycosyltransferase involved in cell wall biosynthesis
VTILSPAAELGGAEQSLLTFLRASGGTGLETTVILPRQGRLADALTSLGIRWRVVPPPLALLKQSRWLRAGSVALAALLPFELPPYVTALAAAVRREAPDVIYSNGVKSHLLASVIAPGLGVPAVWHVRDFLGGRLMARLADQVPTKIITNSRAVAAHLARHMRHPEKLHVVHNAVDCTAFSPTGPPSEPAMRRDAVYRVGLPAVLARWKGHLLFLDAIARLRTPVPRIAFFLIGGSIYDTTSERGYERELRSAITRRGLAQDVVVTGFQENMPPWYRAMDVVVHASTRPEPFGRTVMEAMACGRPVVAAAAGGVPEVVTHGANGLLYPMGDASALADAIARLLRDPDERRRLGVAGRCTALERFTPDAHAARIGALLHDATGLHLASPRCAA